MIELLVGSEGTLGIIVGVQLSLQPVPQATSSVLGSFGSLEEATTAAGMAVAAKASACELLDRTFLNYAAAARGTDAKFLQLIGGAEAILIAEVEGASTEEAAKGAEALADAFRGAGAIEVNVALTPDAEREVWELRHAASPILSTLENAISMQFVEDGAVPLARFPEYVNGVRQALSARKMEGVIFGHAGDGHAHVNPLVDVTQPDWRARMQLLLDDVVALTARLGGTLAGEHGDGSLRPPLLRRVWHKDSLEAFAVTKKAFDPDNIFNPGVKVALPGQKALDDIKYDPLLPPLPPAARSVLDDIVRRRAYNEFRLSLIGGSS
jgi:FAD/FMN-containing dehydrogenase